MIICFSFAFLLILQYLFQDAQKIPYHSFSRDYLLVSLTSVQNFVFSKTFSLLLTSKTPVPAIPYALLNAETQFFLMLVCVAAPPRLALVIQERRFLTRYFSILRWCVSRNRFHLRPESAGNNLFVVPLSHSAHASPVRGVCRLW